MDIKLNQDKFTIQVDRNNVTIAHGTWVVDTIEKTILVDFQELSLPLFDDEELRTFFNDITLFFLKIYNVKVFYRIPMFSHRKMIQIKSKTIMAVEKNDLKQLQNINIDQNKFSFTINKKEIHSYLKSLTEMLSANAFWLTKTDENKTANRIDSSSITLMILYKDNNGSILPVGFARLLTSSNQNLTYLSDIVVATSHQSQGIASYMLNCLFQVFLNDDDHLKGHNDKSGLICLQCADRGSGAESAPKLYRKFGFEYLTESDKNIPLFLNEDYVKYD
ncbi:unnamed protein product [Adineta steineri]|uniref:N-acetyltransferase domain-containing protein n=1 Tax=Adineta steineri TaxID=433720 RepID=A0A819Y4G0_9BILA|nr:unnamed protein product [Adineta steineri]CAF4149382.1 unnamed protein product [Adineta steineri]